MCPENVKSCFQILKLYLMTFLQRSAYKIIIEQVLPHTYVNFIEKNYLLLF